MQQFDLSLWLKDKSRKVVTRRGNPVRIICTDRKHGEDTLPIVFLEESPDSIGEFLLSCRADGTCDNYDTPYDLFFADEEEELTEFEKKLEEIIGYAVSESVVEPTKLTIEFVREWSSQLLDLARKELQPEFDKELEKAYKTQDDVVYRNGYAQGKQDALKAPLESLPKWKKATEDKDFDRHILLFENEDRVVLSTELYEDEYYIELDDLKILPKEE